MAKNKKNSNPAVYNPRHSFKDDSVFYREINQAINEVLRNEKIGNDDPIEAENLTIRSLI